MSETLLVVDNVCKKYAHRLRWVMLYKAFDVTKILSGRNCETDVLRRNEFLAVDHVSFELKRGECIGLVGPNGAGKSTLCKMLSGVIYPDYGSVKAYGSINALIEIGAGFHPLLTGRENIYIKGAMMGLSKWEINEKLDEIIDFAELGEFIDTPVKFYSSGMLVRLGFSIASSIRPDILILDEVLAVGDLKFRVKCYHRMDEIRKNSAMVFVSHSLEQIGRICSRTLLLDKGKVIYYGDVAQGLEKYNSLSSTTAYDAAKRNFYPITCFDMTTHKREIDYGEELMVNFEIESEEDIETTFRLVFFEYPSRLIAGEVNGRGLGLPPFKIKKGHHTYTVKIPALYLRAGKYTIGHNLLDIECKILSAGDGCTNITLHGSGLGETHNQIPALMTGSE